MNILRAPSNANAAKSLPGRLAPMAPIIGIALHKMPVRKLGGFNSHARCCISSNTVLPVACCKLTTRVAWAHLEQMTLLQMLQNVRHDVC